MLFVFYHKKFAGLDLALSSLFWVSNSQTALRQCTHTEADNRYLLPPQGGLEALAMRHARSRPTPRKTPGPSHSCHASWLVALLALPLTWAHVGGVRTVGKVPARTRWLGWGPAEIVVSSSKPTVSQSRWEPLTALLSEKATVHAAAGSPMGLMGLLNPCCTLLPWAITQHSKCLDPWATTRNVPGVNSFWGHWGTGSNLGSRGWPVAFEICYPIKISAKAQDWNNSAGFWTQQGSFIS